MHLMSPPKKEMQQRKDSHNTNRHYQSTKQKNKTEMHEPEGCRPVDRPRKACLSKVGKTRRAPDPPTCCDSSPGDTQSTDRERYALSKTRRAPDPLSCKFCCEGDAQSSDREKYVLSKTKRAPAQTPSTAVLAVREMPSRRTEREVLSVKNQKGARPSRPTEKSMYCQK